MNKTLLFVFGSIGLSLNTEISAAKGIVCKDYDGNPMTVKPKTITIFNNSEVTIYPVLATSKNAVNEWIQGCFRTTEPYPTNYVYKLYVNEGTGIAPGSSVKITLPLYSQLANDRYITWWNGGRIVLADKNERLRNENDRHYRPLKTLAVMGQIPSVN
ncbi:hypothetical protein PGH42_00480 [Legionella pneumophila]|nr:hypothetical protein PGH42_00480 [Legionella pneumophila]